MRRLLAVRKLAACLALLGMLGLVLGSLAESPPGRGTVPSFDRDIAPILQAHCVKCHGAESPKNGLDLRSLAGLLKGGKTGPAVVPGSLRDSLLWTNLATDRMPKGGPKLSDAHRDTLRRWLLEGAARDLGQSAPVVGNPSRTGPYTPRGVPAMARFIDAEIDATLRTEKVPASPLADDAEFCRRVHLDLTGTIPTVATTEAFLASTDPDRRRKLIDQLLDSPEYGRHFATLWHKLLLPRTAEAYGKMDHDAIKGWLADTFQKGEGWDRTVTAMLTSTHLAPMRLGAQNKLPKDLKESDLHGDAAYLTIHHEEGRPQPRAIAASSSRLFLGIQIDCAQCHDHPLAKWKQTEFWGVAAFFERLRYPNIAPAGYRNLVEPTSGPKQLYNEKGRYFVVPAIRPEPVIDLQDQGNKDTGKLVRAKFLDGVEPQMSPQQSYRAEYAKWMTSPENPFFARAAVNRIWGHLMGRGLVMPLDDMQEDNTPSHPALLADLAQEFVTNRFDFKHLIRCICNSQTYQRTSAPTAENKSDTTLFSHQNLKLMTAEVLLDSLSVAVPTLATLRAEKPDSKGRVAFSAEDFLNVLESDELAPTEYSRGLIQALRLMNREGRLANRAALGDRVRDADPPEKNIERIYLLVLSRRPTAEESKFLTEFVKNPAALPRTPLGTGISGTAPAKPTDPYVDIYWALLNSSEFVFNH